MGKTIRYIGDTMEQEIVFPKGPKVNIYADTETFIVLPVETKPGLHIGKPEHNKILKEAINLPGLLVGSFKSINSRKDDDDRYETGGWVVDNSLVWEDNHLAFFRDLQSIYANNYIPVVFFHNASFDIAAISNRWKLLDPDLVLYTYVRSNNKTFLRGAMYSPKFNFKCKFEDTMLFETISIENIGNLIGKPKGKDVPYSMCNVSIKDRLIYYIDLLDGKEKTFPLDEYIEYAKRDVEIQRDYGESLKQKKYDIASVAIENYDYLKESFRGKTQASFAKELTDIYLKHNGFIGGIDGKFRFELPKDNDELYQQTIKSNMGGYTTYNKNIRCYECEESEVIVVFDCNSEYPYILTQEIPYGDILDHKPLSGKYKTWYVVSFRKCEGKDEMSCLRYGPVSLERLNERKDMKFYMLKEYYEMVDRLCDHESVIHEIKYQRTTLVLREFINRLYALRKDLKEKMSNYNHDSKEYEVLDSQQKGCKVIMNSIYGKLCEKSHTEGCFYYSETMNYKTFENKEAVNRCILSGSCITYLGRLILLDKIEKCIKAGFKVLYADTDSVMFVCKKDETRKVVEIFGKDTGDLGQGKCEGVFNLFLNSGVKKKYCLIDVKKPSKHKLAWSGINKKVPILFGRKLAEGNKKVIDDLKIIFNPDENILFKKQKKVAVLSNLYHQKIIYDTDFQMNKAIKKITGVCHIYDDGYVLERYEKEA